MLIKLLETHLSFMRLKKKNPNCYACLIWGEEIYHTRYHLGKYLKKKGRYLFRSDDKICCISNFEKPWKDYIYYYYNNFYFVGVEINRTKNTSEIGNDGRGLFKEIDLEKIRKAEKMYKLISKNRNGKLHVLLNV